MQTIRPSLLTLCLVGLLMLPRLVPMSAAAQEAKPEIPTMSEEARSAQELGRKVVAIQHALDHPETPGSLEAVKALGLDTRYCVMVRGWLSQVRLGDLSIVESSKENTPQKIKDRIAFVEKAIRAIDLEK